MDNELTQKAKEIIENSLYLTLATTSADGSPWNSPVFAAYDDSYTFYWRSDKNAIHSQNIRTNRMVFIVIFDSHAPWGKGKGVYIKAQAVELEDKTELEKALALLDKRSQKTVRKTDAFIHDAPRRIYKAIPEKVWINDDIEINGQFVDKRAEIQLK